jgi:hypothetical protein
MKKKILPGFLAKAGCLAVIKLGANVIKIHSSFTAIGVI